MRVFRQDVSQSAHGLENDFLFGKNILIFQRHRNKRAREGISLCEENSHEFQKVFFGKPAAAVFNKKILVQKMMKNSTDIFILSGAVDQTIKAGEDVIAGIAFDLEAGGQADLKGASGKQRIDETVDGLDLKKIVIANQSFHDAKGARAG